MIVNYALILSAGVGSRMGVIGKVLPKPLWPVFEKNLLDLQIAYLKQFDIGQIYINVHHQADQIINYLKINHSDVKILVEDELLGIGGAIHNLGRQAEVQYDGNLFVINSDQFLMINKTKINNDVNKLKETTALLYSIEVANNDLYGSIQTDSNMRLTKLVPNKELPRGERSITYTGNSLINLNKLTPKEGVSHYFDTIAQYKKETILTDLIEGQSYWDFGTIQRYSQSLYKVLKLDLKDHFKKFLVQCNALNLEKIDIEKMSYNSSTERELNFDQCQFVLNEKHSFIRFQDWEMEIASQSS